MKVKGLLVAAVAAMMCFGAQNASAIEAPNHEGDFNLNVMGGFLSEYDGGVGVSVSGDYVLVNSWWKGHFTVGGFVEYNVDKYKYAEYWDRCYSNFSIMARSTYGLNITDKFEVHAGAMAGFTHWSYKYKAKNGGDEYKPGDDDTKGNDPNGAGLVGCRFYLTDNFALTAECIAGPHLTYFNGGLSFKF